MTGKRDETEQPNLVNTVYVANRDSACDHLPTNAEDPDLNTDSVIDVSRLFASAVESARERGSVEEYARAFDSNISELGELLKCRTRCAMKHQR